MLLCMIQAKKSFKKWLNALKINKPIIFLIDNGVLTLFRELERSPIHSTVYVWQKIGIGKIFDGLR